MPQECAQHGDGYGDDLGWTSVNLTTDRPTAATGGGVFDLHKWGKPHTKKNRKFNLRIHETQPTPAKHYRIHHAYPVKHRKKFARLLIDVNNATHLRWWCNKPGVEGNFRSQRKAYNAAWNKFFRKNKKPSLSKVVFFQRDLERRATFRFRC